MLKGKNELKVERQVSVLVASTQAATDQTALTVTSTYEKYFRVIFHIIDYLWKIEFFRNGFGSLNTRAGVSFSLCVRMFVPVFVWMMKKEKKKVSRIID